MLLSLRLKMNCYENSSIQILLLEKLSTNGGLSGIKSKISKFLATV